MAVIFNMYRFFGPLPGDIFGFLYIYFYMWTSNIISCTSQCSLLSGCILVCKNSKKKKMLNPEESLYFPDQAVCIAGRRDQMASGLKSAEDQLGCISSPTSLGAPSGQVLELRAGQEASMSRPLSGSKDPWTSWSRTGSWQSS